MAKLLSLEIIERVEGAPGFVEPIKYNVVINVDQITLLNAGEDPELSFVRLGCGATLCVPMSLEALAALVEESSK